jgi:hypothetical protein
VKTGSWQFPLSRVIVAQVLPPDAMIDHGGFALQYGNCIGSTRANFRRQLQSSEE